MKPTGDDVVKAFNGLSIAASRARELATNHGKTLQRVPFGIT